MKISPNTFKMYMQKAEKLGYIMNVGSHTQIKNLNYITRDLKLDSFVFVRTVKKGDYKQKYLVTRDFRKVIRSIAGDDLSFKGMYNAVLEAAQLLEFNEQHIKIESNKKLGSAYRSLSNDENYNGANPFTKKVVKAAKKSGKSTDDYSARMLEKIEKDKSIKFGNRFYGKKLNMSPSRTTKTLKGLVSKGFVWANVKVTEHNQVNGHLEFHRVMDVINQKKRGQENKYFYYKASTSQIIEVLGTKVTPKNKFTSLSNGLFSSLVKL